MRYFNRVKRIGVAGVLGFCLLTSVSWSQNTSIANYSQARTQMRALYAQGGTSFYCQCRFKNTQPDLRSCGLSAYANKKRAQRIEWEHIVPAARFGRALPAWRTGDASCISRSGKSYKGRKCAQKNSPAFNFMEADLYNLAPAVGILNAARGSAQMREIDGEAHKFPPCDFERDHSYVEPRPAIRGDIARTYFYMADSYPDHIRLTADEKHLFTRWSEADPVDQKECAHVRDIARLQGNRQHIVEAACAKRKK